MLKKVKIDDQYQTERLFRLTEKMKKQTEVEVKKCLVDSAIAINIVC